MGHTILLVALGIGGTALAVYCGATGYLALVGHPDGRTRTSRVVLSVAGLLVAFGALLVAVNLTQTLFILVTAALVGWIVGKGIGLSAAFKRRP